MNRSNLAKRITSDDIQVLKTDASAFNKFINGNSDGKSIVYILEKLGRLNGKEMKDTLLSLLENPREKIRGLAIKNLAKMSDISLLSTFYKYANEDSSTDVRRESVSAIGRLKDKKTAPHLIKLLADNDPKIVMQAIRGLLPFISIDRVHKSLLSVSEHPNELVREIISSQFIKEKCDKSTTPLAIANNSWLRNKVVLGDVEEVLKYVPKESIDLTFTSPPYYNARDYSIYPSYKDYLICLEKIFKKIYNATKEGRFFILNTSPIIISRVSRSHSSTRYPIPYDIHPLLVKMGWEFIDDIVWVKPEASVKNRNAGFLQHRKPLGYKPNAVTEMIMVYRKKTDKLIDWNMKQYDRKTIDKSKVLGKYETSNVWEIPPTCNGTHSAVFPMELCNRIITLYSYAGDLVFDPFGGSGTFGRAATSLGRDFLLTEKERKYFEYIKNAWLSKSNLFKKETNVDFINLDELQALAKGN